MKKIQNKNAFTLIELIVAITIVAVLTVVGIVSYGPFNKKARDSRRKTDLEDIRMALELYRQGTGYTYPDNLDVLVTAEYLQKVPVGPKEDEVYSYKRESGYKYSIGTTLEETGIGYSVTNP